MSEPIKKTVIVMQQGLPTNKIPLSLEYQKTMLKKGLRNLLKASGTKIPWSAMETVFFGSYPHVGWITFDRLQDGVKGLVEEGSLSIEGEGTSDKMLVINSKLVQEMEKT